MVQQISSLKIENNFSLENLQPKLEFNYTVEFILENYETDYKFNDLLYFEISIKDFSRTLRAENLPSEKIIYDFEDLNDNFSINFIVSGDKIASNKIITPKNL